jgi:hypothetical protein
VKKDEVQAAFVDDIEAGKPEPSLGDARRYVSRVKNQTPTPTPTPPAQTQPQPQSPTSTPTP